MGLGETGDEQPETARLCRHGSASARPTTLALIEVLRQAYVEGNETAMRATLLDLIGVAGWDEARRVGWEFQGRQARPEQQTPSPIKIQPPPGTRLVAIRCVDGVRVRYIWVYKFSTTFFLTMISPHDIMQDSGRSTYVW